MTFSERFLRSERDRFARRWEFRPCCQQELDVAKDALIAFSAEPSALDPRSVSRALAHAQVATALDEMVCSDLALRRTIGVDSGAEHGRPGHVDPATTVLQSMVEAVLAGVDAKYRAAPQLLLALQADRDGDALRSESLLRAALASDPTYGLAAPYLADYQIDRGDLRGALELLHHPELNIDSDVLDLVVSLREDVEGPYRHAGRNDPCPCGSAAKYKQCCLRRPNVPLRLRVRQVLYKIDRFVRLDRHRWVVGDLADVARTATGVVRRDEDLEDGLFIRDLAAFEGGLADRYLAERETLLVPDEADLIRRLIAAPRRPWEVTAVEIGIGLTLVDMVTGVERVVAERKGSISRVVGDKVFARIVLGDGEYQVGGVAIALTDQSSSSLLDLLSGAPDADDLADWYGQAISQPPNRSRS